MAWYPITGGSGGGGISSDVIADEYDASATYNAGDYVIYNDLLYKANADIQIPEAWNASHWDQVSVMSELQSSLILDGTSIGF